MKPRASRLGRQVEALLVPQTRTLEMHQLGKSGGFPRLEGARLLSQNAGQDTPIMGALQHHMRLADTCTLLLGQVVSGHLKEARNHVIFNTTIYLCCTLRLSKPSIRSGEFTAQR